MSQVVPPRVAVALPSLFATGLLGLSVLERVRQTPPLLWSIAGAALLLIACHAALVLRTQRRRSLSMTVSLRPQHYVQACAHTSILLYWGWYWQPVFDQLPLIAAQLLFAYAFEMLLTWHRREEYTLGFGPFPIVLSTNLFLWFRPEWFAWQLVMLAVAFTAKALLQWERGGRRSHIFNPSAFALTVMSLGLLATGTTDVTWGREIAVTQFYPPHMYPFLLLVSLPGQLLFGVASMTLAAVLTTYVFGLCYVAATGAYFFYDSYVPIAVFLGMHLLFTDPATSPRSETGRLFFGAVYGLTVVGLYALLTSLGLPAFYDKLLQVPFMNLAVRAIDRVAMSPSFLGFFTERFGPVVPRLRRNAAYAGVWVAVFVAISAAGGLGDDHRGQWLPFWLQACGAGNARACDYVEQLEATLCRAGSGWACNELGTVRSTLGRDWIGALASWQKGCERGFETACANARDGGRRTAPPTLADLPILLRGSKGAITDTSSSALYQRACALQWTDVCRLVQ